MYSSYNEQTTAETLDGDNESREDEVVSPVGDNNQSRHHLTSIPGRGGDGGGGSDDNSLCLSSLSISQYLSVSLFLSLSRSLPLPSSLSLFLSLCLCKNVVYGGSVVLVGRR